MTLQRRGPSVEIYRVAHDVMGCIVAAMRSSPRLEIVAAAGFEKPPSNASSEKTVRCARCDVTSNADDSDRKRRFLDRNLSVQHVQEPRRRRVMILYGRRPYILYSVSVVWDKHNVLF